jgi:hypothetical protein
MLNIFAMNDDLLCGALKLRICNSKRKKIADMVIDSEEECEEEEILLFCYQNLIE